MKKFNVFLISFACLFLMAWVYLDVFMELQSIYWLCGKLAGFSLIFIGSIFIRISKKEESNSSIIFMVCFAIFWLGYTGYNEITKYKKGVCQDKYGMEFNKKRRSLSAPEIPADWHIKRGYGSSVDWKGKEGVIGHESKTIFIRSCEVYLENDEYHLKSLDTISRNITVTTKYAVAYDKDSVTFYYNVGHDGREISRKQADSVFTAEKIKKDY
jgi:hypothetical protein